MAGYGLSPVRQATGGTIRANNFTDGNGYRIAATAPTAYFEGDLVTYSAGLLVTDMGALHLELLLVYSGEQNIRTILAEM